MLKVVEADRPEESVATIFPVPKIAAGVKLKEGNTPLQFEVLYQVFLRVVPR